MTEEKIIKLTGKCTQLIVDLDMPVFSELLFFDYKNNKYLSENLFLGVDFSKNVIETIYEYNKGFLSKRIINISKYLSIDLYSVCSDIEDYYYKLHNISETKNIFENFYKKDILIKKLYIDQIKKEDKGDLKDNYIVVKENNIFNIPSGSIFSYNKITHLYDLTEGKRYCSCIIDNLGNENISYPLQYNLSLPCLEIKNNLEIFEEL